MLAEEELAELERLTRNGTPWYQFAVHAMPIMPALLAEIRAARAWRKEAELLLREIAKLFTYGDDCQECAIAKDPLVAKLGAFLGE